MKEKISSRQAGIIIFICILANKILLLPSLMFQQTKSDCFFTLIVMFLIDIIMLPIFFKLKKTNPDKKLFDILSQKISKFFATLIYIIFFVAFFFKIILTFSVVYVYLKQNVYQGEFLWISIIAVLPVINHAVVKGIRTLSRTIELFFILILIGFIGSLCLALFTPLSIPTFFTSTFPQFCNSIYKNIFSFGDFLILFVIIDKIKIEKGGEKRIYKYSLFAMGLVVILYYIYLSKYQVTAFMHNNALADILFFSVRFNAIGRLDIISMITIMFITLFQLEIFCYGFCDCFNNVFPLLGKPYIIAFFDILFCLAYYFFVGKYENIVLSFSNWLIYIGIFISAIFPLICLIISFVRRKEVERTD